MIAATKIRRVRAATILAIAIVAPSACRIDSRIVILEGKEDSKERAFDAAAQPIEASEASELVSVADASETGDPHDGASVVDSEAAYDEAPEPDASDAQDDGLLASDSAPDSADADDMPEALPDFPPPPTANPAIAIATGEYHTCVLLQSGAVRCWGKNSSGQIGYGYPKSNNVGDDELPGAAGDVPVGGTVERLGLGEFHSCAILENHSVRCWGNNALGQLGLGHKLSIGFDGSLPSAAGDVPVGAPVLAIAGGNVHTCALLDDGGVRCWGDGSYGQTGHGNAKTFGASGPASDSPLVNLGGAKAIQICAGSNHTCALLEDRTLRCWGSNSHGQLGTGQPGNIGDDEPPTSVPPVAVGEGTIDQIACGDDRSCVLFQGGEVKCWGLGAEGRLGNRITEDVGDNETPANEPRIELGGPARAIAVGLDFSCALLKTDSVRCWGLNQHGSLGYPNHEGNVGDSVTPAQMPTVEVGGPVAAVAAGGQHACALLKNANVVCWGWNENGQLGLKHILPVGDDETPRAGQGEPVQYW